MTKTLTLSVRVHIKLEDIENLLYSAAQGSSYWSDSEQLGYESTVKKALLPKAEGKIVKIVDHEDEPMAYLLNLEKIKKGLTVMAKKEPSHFADFLQENADMITGDVFLQCCLFGEVKYS